MFFINSAGFTSILEAEIDTTLRFDSIADGYNHIQVIISDLAPDFTATLDLNCQRFFDSSFGLNSSSL